MKIYVTLCTIFAIGQSNPQGTYQNKRSLYDFGPRGFGHNGFPSWLHHNIPVPVITKTIKVAILKPYMVHVTKHVKVPVVVQVPRPYQIDVPKAYVVTVEKHVPVHVDKLVPYEVKVPVEVPVIHEVGVDVPRPYSVPVDIPYPVHVPRPVYVEKKVPVYYRDVSDATAISYDQKHTSKGVTSTIVNHGSKGQFS